MAEGEERPTFSMPASPRPEDTALPAGETSEEMEERDRANAQEAEEMDDILRGVPGLEVEGDMEVRREAKARRAAKRGVQSNTRM